ncbi:tyrosinase family protein [Aspergillus saccharolyticus JOP 1030-1]|uniref:Di-copper centre-containing protein n=1 Tax=Aspergillus saccharolyticus JOP 1030-1 TaxID=1450539 RepID=A0A319AKB9_9EURO|nr:Di-copper centre-containing protein [Aspergillus saccharolyticus JOP 1030-1]PYH47062.1 Di-copper centre-containing protein [Aspergillus saccharolyticus JOP 1030-1]
MRLFHTLLLAAAVALAASPPRCHPNATQVRREWQELSPSERTDYIDALWCMRSRPSRLPNHQFPGVRDRLDDFVTTHINNTLRIHNNGLLLPWHRHFTWLWEQALRQECGYTGVQPYWNWALYMDDLWTSPLFDNSATSLSGNGVSNASTAEHPPLCPANLDGCLPPGHGGGCVTAGPFANWTIHLGPFTRDWVKSYGPLPPDPWHYNPRCLNRNFRPEALQTLNNQQRIDRMLHAPDMDAFLSVMDPGDATRIGSHGGGHATVGGAMLDVFASPHDPTFFLHHGMVDRVWTLWQEADFPQRWDALNGTAVIYNPPDAPWVTLHTVMDFGVLDSPRRVGEVMDTRSGRYCYAYT